jgi:hypothetical protein
MKMAANAISSLKSLWSGSPATIVQSAPDDGEATRFPRAIAPEAAREQRLTTWFVWISWLLFAVSAMTLVAKYGRNVLWLDEWMMHPKLIGTEPVTLEWLWSQNQQHRIPLPRLIQIGLARISNADFRAGMNLNVLIMTALSAQLMVAAKRLRGSFSWTDVFFPFALLHWGHAENFLWQFQVAFSVSTWLTCNLLMLIVRRRERFTARQALAAGAYLVLLPLCGAQGAAIAVPLASWMFWAELRDSRRNKLALRSCLVRLALPLLAWIEVYLYFFVGYESTPPLGHVSFGAAMRGVLEFFGAGLGMASVSQNWPYVPIAVVSACLVSLGVLALAWKIQASERASIAGLLLFFAAMSALAVGIAKARAIFPGACAVSRYGWLSAPCTFWIYFVASRYGRPLFSKVMHTLLILGMIFLAKENLLAGSHVAEEMRMKKERGDVLMGADFPALAIVGWAANQHFDRLAPEPLDQTGPKVVNGGL